MARGYLEGPASEEREAELERLERGARAEPAGRERAAVFGSTEEQPERHFIGWRDEVDPDALFAAGTAWGLSVAVIRDPGGRPGT